MLPPVHVVLQILDKMAEIDWDCETFPRKIVIFSTCIQSISFKATMRTALTACYSFWCWEILLRVAPEEMLSHKCQKLHFSYFLGRLFRISRLTLEVGKNDIHFFIAR